MLKIQTFLRGIKNKKTAAPIVYTTVAAMVVLNFSYFDGFNSRANELHVKAETIINLLGEVEETQTSELITTDINKYTFSSLNLDENISITEELQKKEQMMEKETFDVIQNESSEELELLSLETSKKAISAYNENAEVTQEDKEKISTEKISTEKISTEKKEAKTSKKSKISKTSTKEKEATTEVIANGLVKSMNTSMVKTLSNEEVEVLQRIVEAEATGEDIYGKILVANVVLNRVNDEYFPDTVKEVVFQKSGGSYQFSPTKDGRYWSVTVSDTTVEAVERALDGEDYSQGAIYFFARRLTTSKKAKWFDNSLDRLFKYGCHEFYKDK